MPTSLDQLKGTIDGVVDAFEVFQEKNEKRYQALSDQQDEVERKINFQTAGGKAKGRKLKLRKPDNIRGLGKFQRSLQTFGRAPLPPNANFNVGDYATGFRAYMRGGERLLTPEQTLTMRVGIDPDGGYLAPPDVVKQILRVEQLNSVMRGLVTIWPTSSGVVEIPNNTNVVSASWVGEEAARPATGGPVIGVNEVFVKELYAEPEVTQKLLDDTDFNLEGFVSEKIGEAFAIAEDAAFLTGAGLVTPRGLLTYPTSSVGDLVTSNFRPFGTIQYVPSGQAGAWPATDPLIYDFLTSITMALKPGYRKNAKWVMPTSVILRVMQIKDLQGRPIWQPSLIAGQPAMLLGYPVVEAEQMPVVSANSYSIAFGDWRRAYWIVDRFGIRMLRDPYTNKPFIRYYTTKRMGGGLQDSLAVKLGKFSAS